MRRRTGIAFLIVFSFAAAAACAGEALAQKRVALVVGNSAYQHTPKLTNPKNDATDMVAAFKVLGFEVVEGFDLDKAGFDRKVRDFATALEGAAVGVFFYAGHGLQVAGQNYLVPVDAQLSTAVALDFEMMKVEIIHRAMERLTKTNVLFLDACRDNPLARNLARSLGTRSTEVGKGLAQIEAGSGTLISFSTHPGAVASDGAGRNSPYAGALVKHLATSNDDLNAILIAVRNDVMTATQEAQVPWEHSALRGRFYFNPASQTAEPAKVAPARLSEAAEAWGAAERTTSIAALETFIARYKETFYAELARARIEELKKQQSAAAKSELDRQTQERKRAEADARAKADAERQRLAMLQQEEERRRAETEAAKKRAGAGNATAWAELGCKQVSLAGPDHDTIRLGRRGNGFKAIRLNVRGNDVELLTLMVIYVNGAPDRLDVRHFVRQGERTRPLDLKGERPIDRVDLAYRTVPNFKGTATVCVEGLQ